MQIKMLSLKAVEEKKTVGNLKYFQGFKFVVAFFNLFVIMFYPCQTGFDRCVCDDADIDENEYLNLQS